MFLMSCCFTIFNTTSVPRVPRIAANAMIPKVGTLSNQIKITPANKEVKPV